MNVNYDLLLPSKILFSLKEIEDLGVIKTDMAKKLVYSGFLEVVKIGNKMYALIHSIRPSDSIIKKVRKDLENA